MKENISLITKLNELRLLLIHPQTRNKVFILVEGDSDIKLFRKLFHHQNTEIKSIPGGYTNLELGLKELSKNYRTVIGIRDADFMHIEKKKPQIQVLFLTDVHDMEMMMIISDETLKSILFEFSSDTKFKIKELRNKFLESIKFIGYVRWYNSIHNLELNFKDLGIGEFINNTNLEIDEISCIAKVLQRSPNKKTNDAIELRNNVKKLIKSTHDLAQICCGHDIAKIIALFLSLEKLNKGVSQERIESHLRTTYNFTQFQKTKLYKSLKNWSIENERDIFNE
jgi:hypothetical protein